MNINKYCELCDNVATTYDRDLGMYLCQSDYNAFNGVLDEVELDEVYE